MHGPRNDEFVFQNVKEYQCLKYKHSKIILV